MARYSSASSCGAQAALLDVPNLPPTSQSGRSDWTQAALVWDMALSEQFDDALRSGISKFNRLPSLADTPSSALSPVFQVTAHGYTFDVSAMRVIEPARTWTIAAASQSRLVDSTSQVVLDRMATRAGAAATQRTLALAHFWTDALGLPDARRSDFLAAIASTPIVVPIDAFASGVAAQLAANATSFPASPSCASGAASAYTSVESGVFGLDAAAASCAGRPVYGFVNVFGLRAPFLDNDPRRASLPGQGIVLASAVSARAVLHAGESVLLGATSSTPPAASAPIKPSRYGTTTALDSVVLDWLQLMPSLDVARQVVAFVLAQSNSRPVPPALNSTLALATNGLLDIVRATCALPRLTSQPVLEAAIFGSLPYASSVGGTLSRIGPAASPGNATTSIFGTPEADAFRRWALQTPPRRTSGNALGWTQGALDPVVSREVGVGAADDFEPIWRAGRGRSVQSVCDRLEAAKLVGP